MFVNRKIVGGVVVVCMGVIVLVVVLVLLKVVLEMYVDLNFYGFIVK